MKKRIGFVVLVIFLFVGAFLGFWAYKYYGYNLPSLPDKHYYENLSDRAQAAHDFAKSHRLNENYCFLVDYSIPSGTPRLFVWSFQDNRAIASTYVMHGPGKGSTAEKPVFSSTPGSNCSSLGRFAVTKMHGSRLKRSYRLKGLDVDNQTALCRGLMLHSSVWVDVNCWRKYIPLHSLSCQGCITVSTRGLDYLEKLIDSQGKMILLWSFD